MTPRSNPADWLNTQGAERKAALDFAAEVLLADYMQRWPCAAPVDLLRLAESLGAEITRIRDLEGGARLIPLRGGFQVLVSETLESNRARVAIAHELAHTLFYDRQTEAPKRLIAPSNAEEHFCADLARRLLAPSYLLTTGTATELRQDELYRLAVDRFQLSRLAAARLILQDYGLGSGTAARWQRTAGGWLQVPSTACKSDKLSPLECSQMDQFVKNWLEDNARAGDDYDVIDASFDPGGESVFVFVGSQQPIVNRLGEAPTSGNATREGTLRDHIFISYATEDGLFVDWLCLRLAAEGYSVWCDRLKLLGGESYPGDIDRALKERTFKVVAVLSKHSISKPNPTKERTLALQLGRERNEDFVIPVNLTGLSPTEIDWMQSDLTFIRFDLSWAEGLRALLRKLEQAGAPRAFLDTSSISMLLNSSDCVDASPERLWTNLVTIKRLPSCLFRYEHELPMTKDFAVEALRLWPHYRENASVCWSFEAPPPDLRSKFRFGLYGTCERWRYAEGPDLNFLHIGKKVCNATLRHRLLRAGMAWDQASQVIYFASIPKNERFAFTTYNGTSWLKAVGIRSFATQNGRIQVRYHLAPFLRTLLDRTGHDRVEVKVKLYLIDVQGQPLPAAVAHRRRKSICRSWWNHQWLSRVFAILEVLSESSDSIRIGYPPDQQLVLGRFPLSLSIAHRLLEQKLRLDREAENADVAIAAGDDEVLEEESSADELHGQ
jgi:hypothetical protein